MNVNADIIRKGLEEWDKLVQMDEEARRLGVTDQDLEARE